MVDALGHTAGEAVEENRVEATSTAAGSYDSVVYCSICNEELSRETVEIPQLAPAGTITDTGRSLSLQGVVFINQYVKVTGFEGIDIAKNGGLLIWNSQVTEETALFGTQDVHQAGLIASKTEYAQQTLGIPASKYADTLYLRVYVKVGENEYVYGPVAQYSVRQYCENQINKANAKQTLKDTCVAMLHYGAAAQINFKYNTGDLANKNIIANYPVPEWDGSLLTPVVEPNTKLVGTGDVKDNGKSLSLSGAVCVNFYFQPDSSIGTPASAELLVWENVTGELTLNNVSYTKELIKSNNEYAQQSEMISAAKLGNTIYACAKFVDKNGNEHYSDVVAYSPELYAANQITKNRNQELIATVKAMVVYGECANIYLNKK